MVDVTQEGEAILKELRDRKLLKWLFMPEPEYAGAYGYLEQPLDSYVQNECAEELAKVSILAHLSKEPTKEEVEAAAITFANGMHKFLPEEERPQALCDFSEEQQARMIPAAKAALTASRQHMIKEIEGG